MALSNQEVDLKPHYKGLEASGSERVHTWAARWDLPDGQNVEEWRQRLADAVTYDRVLEPMPTGASFDADLAGRTLIVTAWLAEADAPSDPVERDAIGKEVIGLVQGLIVDS